jgi:hypothetical protein
MAQEQDIMGTFKRLSRINREGGSMSPEERNFFDRTKKQSEKLQAQAKASIYHTKPINEDTFSNTK